MLNLKEIRLRKGLSQVQLSKKSGVSQSYISELENDGYNCTAHIICDLCQALEVTPNDLIDKNAWSNNLGENE